MFYVLSSKRVKHSLSSVYSSDHPVQEGCDVLEGVEEIYKYVARDRDLQSDGKPGRALV